MAWTLCRPNMRNGSHLSRVWSFGRLVGTVGEAFLRAARSTRVLTDETFRE